MPLKSVKLKRNIPPEETNLDSMLGYRLGPEEAPPPPKTGEGMVPDILQNVAATGLRVLTPMAGAVGGSFFGPVGTVAGGATGGALGDIIAQKVEPGGLDKSLNKGRVALGAGLGALPGSASVTAGRVLPSIIKGVGIGAGSVAGERFLGQKKTLGESVDPREWSAGEIIAGPIAGGTISGLVGGLAQSARKPVPKPTPPPYQGQSGLRVALDKASKAPSGPASPDTIAQHAALAAEVEKNPVGPIATEIGVPSKKPSLVDLAKDESEGWELRGKEKADAAKAQTKMVESEATQAARNLNARDKHLRTVEVAEANAESEAAKMAAAAKKEADNQARLGRIEAEKAGRVPTDYSVGESVSGTKPDGTKASMSRRFVKEEPPVDADGAPIYTRDYVEKTGFDEESEALRAALATGGQRVAKIGDSWIVRYGPEAPTPSGPAPTPPQPLGPAASKFQTKAEDIANQFPSPEGPAPTPAPTPAPKPKGPAPASAALIDRDRIRGIIDRDRIRGKRFRSKAEASAVAKYSGGTLHQAGPRGKWSVRFDDETSILPDIEDVAPAPPVDVEPAPFKPAKPYVPDTTPAPKLDMGDLSPEEFKRYMAIRPGTGTKRTPAELDEYRALHAKLTRQPPPKAEAPSPVEPTSKPSKPEMTVEDFAGALSKEGDKPIAEAPFSLARPVAKGATSKQAALGEVPDPQVEAMLDRVAGEPGGVPTGMNPRGQGTIPAGIPDAPASKGAVPVADKIGKARATYSPEANAELDRIGEAYRTATDPAKKRELGQELAAAGRKAKEELAAKTAKEAPVQKAPPVQVGSAELQAQLDQRRKDIANPDWIAEQLAEVEKARGPRGGSTLSSTGAGQLQNMLDIAQDNPQFAAKLVGGLGGGVVGYNADDEHPILGAAAGTLAGIAGGSAAAHAIPRLRVGEDIKDVMDPILDRVPNFMRGGLLSHPLSMAWNSIGGPWGSQMVGGLEESLKGAVTKDPERAKIGLTAMRKGANLPAWLRRVQQNLPEAKVKLHDVEEMGRGGTYDVTKNPNVVDKLSEVPGIAMLAGDLTSKGDLVESGFSDALARKVTLTNEPDRAAWRAVVNWAKTKSSGPDGQPSRIAKIMLPFVRTAANIMESGIDRTPVVGSIANYFGDKSLRIPAKEQAVQQVLGAGFYALGYQAGSTMDEETVKAYKLLSLTSNLAGRYSLLAGAGFMAGQAKRRGQGTLEAMATSAARAYAGEGLPLPSTQSFQDIYNPVIETAKTGTIPPLTEMVPTIFKPRVLEFAESTADYLGAPSASGQRSRGPRRIRSVQRPNRVRPTRLRREQ